MKSRWIKTLENVLALSSIIEELIITSLTPHLALSKMQPNKTLSIGLYHQNGLTLTPEMILRVNYIPKILNGESDVQQ